jgi:hypothetical protein
LGILTVDEVTHLGAQFVSAQLIRGIDPQLLIGNRQAAPGKLQPSEYRLDLCTRFHAVVLQEVLVLEGHLATIINVNRPVGVEFIETSPSAVGQARRLQPGGRGCCRVQQPRILVLLVQLD